MEKIQERENDLKKLRDGELHSSKKKQKMDENLRNEAFERYLSLFYNRTSVTLPEHSDNGSDIPLHQDEDVYIPDVEPNGFFCIDHQSSFKYRNTIEDEDDSSVSQSVDIPQNRLRSQSLPIINEEPCLEYDENVVLEDTSVDLPGNRTALSPSPIDKNKEKTKRRSNSAGKKYKHRVQKEIVVGKSPGSYPVPVNALQEVSRECTELAMVEDENGKQYEAILIAPDGCIPNSVVAALFDDMRGKKEPEVQEEVIPYRPPQLTLAQLLEIKASAKITVCTTSSYHALYYLHTRYKFSIIYSEVIYLSPPLWIRWKTKSSIT